MSALLLALLVTTTAFDWPGERRAAAELVVHLKSSWVVCDDSLAIPLGVIRDADVGPDGTTHLLDEQNLQIRRFDRRGIELPPLSRSGEGPGELSQPARLAVRQDSACLVVPRELSRRVTCVLPSNEACEPPSLTTLPSPFDVRLPLALRRGPDGSVLVALSGAKIDRETGDILERGQQLIQWGPSGAKVAFSTLDRSGGISIEPERGTAFVLNGWSVNDSGLFAYASPAGDYAICFGHPPNQPSRVLTLLGRPEDEEGLQQFSKEYGIPTHSLSRVASVRWINDEWVAVEPLGSVLRNDTVATFDMVSRDEQEGRYRLILDYDRHNDLLFWREGFLIVIRGGGSARRAALAELGVEARVANDGSEDSHEDVDSITVEFYDLSRNLGLER